ncbi:disulfide bond formation protein B [Nostoc sp. CHAB 5834]|nr:disulfide bond formation protein B [Nostoc sp. CHAB 5834]
MKKSSSTRTPAPRSYSFRAALALSIASGAAVTGSLIAQYVFQMDPCPLCLSQRFTFLVLCLLGMAWAAFPRIHVATLSFWTLVVALCVFGLYLSGYHASLLMSVGESCSMLVPKVLGKIQEALPSALSVILDGTGSCTPDKGSLEFKQTASLIGAAVVLQMSILGLGVSSICRPLFGLK